MAAAAVASSERFSWDLTVTATLDLYAEAVRAHRGRALEFRRAAALPAAPQVGLRAVAP